MKFDAVTAEILGICAGSLGPNGQEPPILKDGLADLALTFKLRSECPIHPPPYQG